MTGVPSWLNVRPTRGTAFAIHLFVSLLVFSTLVAVMLVYWFPGDLFIMDGGWEGLKLVAMVDLVLGPALTLILFKPGKPGLKFDLSVIAAVQIAALLYGFYTTYNQRTIAIVFAENEFATVSAQDRRDADTTLIELDIQPGSIPKATAFNIPLLRTPAAENMGSYLESILNGYPSAHERNDQYVALTGTPEDMKRHQLSIEDLEHNGAWQRVQKAMRSHELTSDDLQVYEFRARYADGYALYDPQQNRIIDFVRHEPTPGREKVAQTSD